MQHSLMTSLALSATKEQRPQVRDEININRFADNPYQENQTPREQQQLPPQAQLPQNSGEAALEGPKIGDLQDFKGLVVEKKNLVVRENKETTKPIPRRSPSKERHSLSGAAQNVPKRDFPQARNNRANITQTMTMDNAVRDNKSLKDSSVLTPKDRGTINLNQGIFASTI